MKRHLRMALVLTLLLTALGTLAPASAHPVTVDGNAAEWNPGLGVGPAVKNVGHLIRNGSGQGEYAWNDADNDARPFPSATSPLTKELDLRQFRVTGDATNLYLYAQFAEIATVPALAQLQVALDTDGSGSGSTFVAPATITPTILPAAEWTHLLRTEFDTGVVAGNTITAAPTLYAPGGPVNPQPLTAGVLSLEGNSMELSVPWTALGGLKSKIRFSVAVLRADGQGADVADEALGTNILDLLSRIGDANPNTFAPSDTVAELKDDDLDYYVTVNFKSTGPPAGKGEVYSPLLVTEVSLRPDNNSLAQWFEITNFGPNITAANLAKYKAGDAVGPTQGEGMFLLPNRSLGTGESIIVTYKRQEFRRRYPSTLLGDSPSNYTVWEVYTDTTDFSLDQYPGWAGRRFDMRSLGDSFTDQALLLDLNDTIIDMVEYGAGNRSPSADHLHTILPTVPSSSGPRLQTSIDLQRCPFDGSDTNNRVVGGDVVTTTVKLQHTPLAASRCDLTDVSVGASGPGTIQLDAQDTTQHVFTLSYKNTRLVAGPLTITETLPLGMSYVSHTASDPTLGAPAQSTAGDGRQVLVWSLPTLAAGAAGTIAISAELPAGTPATLTSANDVLITVAENDNDPSNNSASLPVAYLPEFYVDVQALKSVQNDSIFFPGGSISYLVGFSNTGTLTAENVTLLDAYPAILSYASNSAGLPADTTTAGQVQLSVGQLPPGGSGSVVLTFLVDADAADGTSIQNQVTIATSSAPETPTTNNVALSPGETLAATPTAPNLRVSKQVKDAGDALPGAPIVYTISVENIGTQPASAVQIQDSFPASLSYQAGGYSANLTLTESVGTGVVTFDLAEALAPGAQLTLDITFTIKGGTSAGTSVQNAVAVPLVAGEVVSADNNALSEVTTVQPQQSPENTIYLPLVVR